MRVGRGSRTRLTSGHRQCGRIGSPKIAGTRVARHPENLVAAIAGIEHHLLILGASELPLVLAIGDRSKRKVLEVVRSRRKRREHKVLDFATGGERVTDRGADRVGATASGLDDRIGGVVDPVAVVAGATDEAVSASTAHEYIVTGRSGKGVIPSEPLKDNDRACCGPVGAADATQVERATDAVEIDQSPRSTRIDRHIADRDAGERLDRVDSEHVGGVVAVDRDIVQNESSGIDVAADAWCAGADTGDGECLVGIRVVARRNGAAAERGITEGRARTAHRQVIDGQVSIEAEQVHMALAASARDQMAVVGEIGGENLDAADGVRIDRVGAVGRMCIEESDLVGIGNRHAIEHDRAAVNTGHVRCGTAHGDPVRLAVGVNVEVLEAHHIGGCHVVGDEELSADVHAGFGANERDRLVGDRDVFRVGACGDHYRVTAAGFVCGRLDRRKPTIADEKEPRTRRVIDDFDAGERLGAVCNARHDPRAAARRDGHVVGIDRRVGSGATVDGIVAGTASDDVVAASARDRIGTGVASDGVVGRVAGDVHIGARIECMVLEREAGHAATEVEVQICRIGQRLHLQVVGGDRFDVVGCAAVHHQRVASLRPGGRIACRLRDHEAIGR